VISAGFLLLAGSVILFWHADTAALLLVARAAQGFASGLLLSTLSAAVVDLEPEGRRGAAAVVNAVAPMLGLALGAVAAGVLLDVAADPATGVFAPLAIGYLVLAAVAWASPETSPRHDGWWRSLMPRIAIPATARKLFLLSAPAVLAGWATGGLFLSLGASIVRSQFGAEAHIWQGLAITFLAGAGALAAFLIRGRTARTITIYGTAALAVGTLLSLGALAFESLPAYLAAMIVAGSGFGTAFMGVLRSIIPTVGAGERAETFASIYTISYLAFSVPAVAAGIAASIVSLAATTYIYGGAVVVLAAGAALLRLRTAD
jgi:hypothetical protein